MKKTDLVNALYERCDRDIATVTSAGRILEGVLDIIQETVCKGESVCITGFGTFEAKDVAERNGTNPATGEAMVIPAHTRVTFKAGSKFKKAAQ